MYVFGLGEPFKARTSKCLHQEVVQVINCVEWNWIVLFLKYHSDFAY